MTQRSDPDRDRDPSGRPRNARMRDALGRPRNRVGDQAPGPEARALAPDEALRRGQQLLDAGEAFSAHEVFEAVWKATPGRERELWRGLAQLCVGITHALRGNPTGAAALLQRAAETLTPYTGTAPHDVDVDGLRTWAVAASRDLTTATQPPRLRGQAA
jgi:hypothetical protein